MQQEESFRKLIDGTNPRSKVIFLYEAVVNTEQEQFTVSQLINEAHNTNSIQFWLMEWLRSGAPYPKEVVCDYSKALLDASVRVFTGLRNFHEYSNAGTEIAAPACYIRLDVAHFIKMYVEFLKKRQASDQEVISRINWKTATFEKQSGSGRSTDVVA